MNNIMSIILKIKWNRQFLKKYNFSKWQEETENLDNHISVKEIKTSVKNISTKRKGDPPTLFVGM